MRTQRRGFSAIELLIVMAMASILASIALASWREQVLRMRRTEAQAALLQLMQQQERYASQHNTFIAFSADSVEPDARAFRWWSGRIAPASAYEIEGKACDGEPIAACVQLIATPGTPRVDPLFKDAECGQLILTSSGERMARGPAVRCWR